MNKELSMRFLDGNSDPDGGNNSMRKTIVRTAAMALPAVFGLWLLTACYKAVAPGHVGIV